VVDEPDNSSHEWTEVHIQPNSGQPKEQLLLKVIDPLVHDEFAERIESWHYFWEPELLLRIRWLRPAEAENDQGDLRVALDRAKTAGQLDDWQIVPYTGEAPDYGEEMWDNSFHDWMAGSELALAIVKFDAQGQLSKDRFYHWHRRVHLFSNELGLDWFFEGYWSLAQAHGYLDRAVKDEEARQVPADKRRITRDTVNEVERILKQLTDKLEALAAGN
jgi:Lantibiotic biosynthesis dehydratase C-term